MHSRSRALATALLLLLVTLLTFPAAPTVGAEADTMPPTVTFNVCPGATDPHACQRYEVAAYETEVASEDLAVVGARIGDQVLDTYVYNDGTGPVRYGGFAPPGNDVVFDVAWALTFDVPPGTNVVTFWASDLGGNTTEEDVTLTAATAPARPRPVAKRTGPRAITVSNVFNADGHGARLLDAEVRHRGHKVRVLRIRPPMGQCCTTYRNLPPGRHDFTVRVKSQVGWSQPTTVRAWIPRKHRYQ